MLKAKCIIAWCRNIAVKSRYHWPSATAGQRFEHGVLDTPDEVEILDEPVAHREDGDEDRRVDAQQDLRDQPGVGRDRAAREGARLVGRFYPCPVPEPCLTQSGHWNPTEALIMHSGQIGRSQRVQLMPVSVPGCR